MTWCFDDLLTTMAPVAATTASPDDKLILITPSSFACAVVNLLEVEWVVLLGMGAGLAKVLVRRWWSFPLVVVAEAGLVAWRAHKSQERFDDCWARWKVLLPEHTDNIASMEAFWRAYLQTRPNFTIAAAIGGFDGNFSLLLRVLPPWVPASESYTVHYRMQPTLLSSAIIEWNDQLTPELATHAAFEKHVASNGEIELGGLEMGSAYEVRVDAVVNGRKSVVRGTVVSCMTGHPVISVTEDADVRGLVHVMTDVPWSGKVTLRYRQGRWPWRYRRTLLSMLSPEFELDTNGKCDFEGLTAGSVLRVEFM